MNFFEQLIRQARKRSPWLFHLNAGACNGCDIEFLTCLSPRYDAEQLGVRLEASPRHADILCVSGPVTLNTKEAVLTIYNQVADPKVVVALGSCPATCNVFAGSPMIAGPLERLIPVDVYIPGCPPAPDTIMAGIVRAVEIFSQKEPAAAGRLASREVGGAALQPVPVGVIVV